MFLKITILSIILTGMSFLSLENEMSPNNFKEDQLTFPRVKRAYDSSFAGVEEKLSALNITSPRLFLRAFKKEETLEVWASDTSTTRMQLITTYAFCKNSGLSGPKRKSGDFQIPEGVYYIDRFNPESNYHLSLGINYPNASDSILSSAEDLGGDIFIHGGCETIGCIPITDALIEELYVFCVEARNSGQNQIPVHIFPARMTLDNYQALCREYDYDVARISFWKNLKEIFENFEYDRQLPNIEIQSDGSYSIQ